MISQFPDSLSAGTAPAALRDAFERPRNFLGNHFVYLVISSRAGGLSVGVNLNPATVCTFNCLYCEVDRGQPQRVSAFDVDRMEMELHQTLQMARDGRLKLLSPYSKFPMDLLKVRHVALSGDGEPTLSPHFVEAIQAVVHLRAMDEFFKIVLITNSTALDQPHVREGLKFLTSQDEIWAKLDGGTQEYLNRLNGSTMPLEKILDNILTVGRRRPIIIQSLFPSVNGVEPSAREIQEYAQRLKELKREGAQISLVQIYSAIRPMAQSECTHLPLKTLSQIAATVRSVTGLNAEVF